jgi:OCRE domain
VLDAANIEAMHVQDPAGIMEKGDLVARVEVAAATAAASNGTAAVPPGYVFDPKSKYYYSEQSQMFYDAASGGYFSQGDGNWYSWDGSAFVAHPKP